MKKALLLPAVLLLAASGFADTIINSFDHYNDHWYGFGDNVTQTHVELFRVPTNGNSVLTSFSFYLGNAIPDAWVATEREPTITGAYIATWSSPDWINGHAGQVLFSSPKITYENEELTVNTAVCRFRSGRIT